MNITLTNIWLAGHGGTEVYVRDLACALHRQGNHVEVYSPILGAVAGEIQAAGIHVVDSVEALVQTPDLIHAHHFIPTMEMIGRFPETPLIYFLHDRTHLIDTPPKYPRIQKYMAVDYNCLDRLLIDNGIPKEKTGVIYNWVDTDRFPLREAFADRPRKALVFSNYATPDNYFKAVQAACGRAGIVLDGVGAGLGNPVKDPEKLLPQYDLVFAKAKAAMEAMASGAAVIPCDITGMGEMVTMENFEEFRKYNFGMKILKQPVEPDRVLREIEKYHPENCRQTADEIRKKAAFDLYVKNIMEIYRTVIAEDKHEPVEQDRLYGRLAQDYLSLKQYLYLNKINNYKHAIDDLQAKILEHQRHQEEQTTFLENLKAEKEEQLQALQNRLEAMKTENEKMSTHLRGVKGSRSYQLGRFLTWPIRRIKNRTEK